MRENMAKVGAQRAATLTGKSKSTVQRAMNNGKLSFELDQNKRRVIDVSELERVFGIKKQNTSPAISPKDTSPDMLDEVESERMKMQIKMLEQQLATANEYVDDLKDQRDKWEKQASQTLITSQYSQKQADELRTQIKDREERIRKKRRQQQAGGNSRPRSLDNKMKQLKAQNENMSGNASSVFRFWKKAKG